jgi:formate-dependent nitrite reductase cytochrome c552 subunit
MLTGASNLESYISNMGISLSAKELTSSDKEAIKKQIRDIDKTIEDLRGKKTDKSYIQKYIDDYQAWQNVVTSGGIEINKTIEDIQKQQEKANKDLIDKTKAVTEA